MNDTPSLFDSLADAPPAQSHSDTSCAAADRIKGVSGRLRREVYDWLAARGEAGGTDEEIQAALTMPSSTERPRRVELVRAGRVRDSGKRRSTRSGRKAVVWTVAKP